MRQAVNEPLHILRSNADDGAVTQGGLDDPVHHARHRGFPNFAPVAAVKPHVVVAELRERRFGRDGDRLLKLLPYQLAQLLFGLGFGHSRIRAEYDSAAVASFPAVGIGNPGVIDAFPLPYLAIFVEANGAVFVAAFAGVV